MNGFGKEINTLNSKAYNNLKILMTWCFHDLKMHKVKDY